MLTRVGSFKKKVPKWPGIFRNCFIHFFEILVYNIILKQRTAAPVISVSCFYRKILVSRKNQTKITDKNSSGTELEKLFYDQKFQKDHMYQFKSDRQFEGISEKHTSIISYTVLAT